MVEVNEKLGDAVSKYFSYLKRGTLGHCYTTGAKKENHVQVWTSLTKDKKNKYKSLHYEYWQKDGYVQLHFENWGKCEDFKSDKYRFFRNALRKETSDKSKYPDLKWDDWKENGDTGDRGINCRCIYKKEMNSIDEIIKGFDYLIKVFDKRIEKMIEKNTAMEEYIRLLESNHNLILTGAPGTGKTYLARQIAETMKAETAFVQFHPSYDYTDFVEGLRPKNDEDGNIGFERKDGVFKDFCKKALNNLLDSKKPEEDLNSEERFKEAYEKLIDDIQTGNITKIPLKTPNYYMDIVEISNNNNIYLKAQETNSSKIHIVSCARLLKLSNKFKTTKDLDEIKNIDKSVREQIGGCNTSAYWATLHYIYESYYNKSAVLMVVPKQKVEEKKFVFIIDEINRGDISKIFGELFFSIDPGYRGEKGKVKTQYQNLIEKGDDVFDDGFYIPENVYIIGTMNDIDRSVESMDFAMRRRFGWKEITAKSQIGMLDRLLEKDDDIKYPMVAEEIDKAKNRLANLNDEIVKEKYGLSAAYHIGPSYFLKLGLYEGDRFESLWNNHIKGVLYEYLRGNEEIDELIEDLRKAYNYDQDKDSKAADKQEQTNEKSSESET